MAGRGRGLHCEVYDAVRQGVLGGGMYGCRDPADFPEIPVKGIPLLSNFNRLSMIGTMFGTLRFI